MVDSLQKKDCNGCRACADVCPKGAVSYQRDALTGFDYPVVDQTLCIKCGLCLKKCTQIHPLHADWRSSPKVYAAWSKDDKTRLMCTSGGIFYELAYAVIAYGGRVAACCYTEDYRGAVHTIASSMDEVIPQCGSKHVQSQTLHIYQRVKQCLGDNQPVLFVGTPCQVAALYSYLGSDYDHLYTADFICNSINSPKAQEHYIDYLEEIYGSEIVFSRAKDKRYGWNHFGSSARFKNGKEYYASREEDARVVGYHHGHLFIRESCLNCQYKQIPRNADITIADFWGIEADERNPKLELGTSLVMINSEKGQRLFDQTDGRVSRYEESFEKALKGNRAILYSATTNGNGMKAFAALDHERFDRVVERYKTKDGKADTIKRFLVKLSKKLRRKESVQS